MTKTDQPKFSENEDGIVQLLRISHDAHLPTCGLKDEYTTRYETSETESGTNPEKPFRGTEKTPS